jgi:hypothetical protein
MDWIHLAQDRDRWRALGNTVEYVGIDREAGRLAGSREERSPMELGNAALRTCIWLP